MIAINPDPGAPIEYEAGGNLSALNYINSGHKHERQLNHDLVGSVTKVLNRWTLKVGAEQRIYLSNYEDHEESFQISSSAGYTTQFINATGGTVGTPLPNAAGWLPASTLLGAGFIHIAGGRGIEPALAQKYSAIYSQNDWHATNRLTVNLGLRWEVQPAPTERHNALSGFSFNCTNPYGSAGCFTFPSTGGLDRGLWKTNWKDFGPRVGVAFRLSDSMVLRAGYGISYLPSNTGFFDGPYAYGEDTFSPGTNGVVYGTHPAGLIVGTYGQTTQIIPVCTTPSCPGLYGAPNPRFDSFGYKDGSVQQWNVFLQRRIGSKWLVQAGYSAAKGSHLPYARIPLNSAQFISPSTLGSWQQNYVASNGKTNPATVQVPNPYQPTSGALLPFNGDWANATVSTLESLYSYPLFGGMTPERSIGFSDYNSLQLSVQRNYANGLQFMANYTWSKSIDMTQTEAQTNGFSDTGGYDQTDLDLLNYANNKKLSTTDVPQRFVVSAVYELPFGKGKTLQTGNRIGDAMIGGWRLGGVAIISERVPCGDHRWFRTHQWTAESGSRSAHRSTASAATLVRRKDHRHAAERPAGHALQSLLSEVRLGRLSEQRCTNAKRCIFLEHLLVGHVGARFQQHSRPRTFESRFESRAHLPHSRKPDARHRRARDQFPESHGANRQRVLVVGGWGERHPQRGNGRGSRQFQ